MAGYVRAARGAEDERPAAAERAHVAVGGDRGLSVRRDEVRAGREAVAGASSARRSSRRALAPDARARVAVARARAGPAERALRADAAAVHVRLAAVLHGVGAGRRAADAAHAHAGGAVRARRAGLVGRAVVAARAAAVDVGLVAVLRAVDAARGLADAAQADAGAAVARGAAEPPSPQGAQLGPPQSRSVSPGSGWPFVQLGVRTHTPLRHAPDVQSASVVQPCWFGTWRRSRRRSPCRSRRRSSRRRCRSGPGTRSRCRRRSRSLRRRGTRRRPRSARTSRRSRRPSRRRSSPVRAGRRLADAVRADARRRSRSRWRSGSPRRSRRRSGRRSRRRSRRRSSRRRCRSAPGTTLPCRRRWCSRRAATQPFAVAARRARAAAVHVGLVAGDRRRAGRCRRTPDSRSPERQFARERSRQARAAVPSAQPPAACRRSPRRSRRRSSRGRVQVGAWHTPPVQTLRGAVGGDAAALAAAAGRAAPAAVDVGLVAVLHAVGAARSGADAARARPGRAVRAAGAARRRSRTASQVEPPQSMSVSSPFFTWSSQVGGGAEARRRTRPMRSPPGRCSRRRPGTGRTRRRSRRPSRRRS